MCAVHDIKALREDAAGFNAAMARRGLVMPADGVIGQDEARRAAVAAL